jgi:hypothetical protein
VFGILRKNAVVLNGKNLQSYYELDIQAIWTWCRFTLLYSVPKTQKYWIQLSLDASICCLAMLDFVYVCAEDKIWCCVVGFLVQILVLKSTKNPKM